MNQKTKRTRGAAMVEYALLLFAVLIVSAAAVKSIGPKVKEAAESSVTALGGGEGSAGDGPGGGGARGFQ